MTRSPQKADKIRALGAEPVICDVFAAEGVVLRYGRLYGHGTYYEQALPPPPRVHVDEAATRTTEALSAPSGVIAIVEDQECESSTSAARWRSWRSAAFGC